MLPRGGGTGISNSQISRLCEEIDDSVDAFLTRPIEGEWPYLWIDATYLKMRQVADQMRPKLPKMATLMDGTEEDVLAYMTFPQQLRTRKAQLRLSPSTAICT